LVVTSWYWDVQLVGSAPMLGVAALAFDLAVVVVVVGFTVVEVVEAWKAVSCEWASEMVAGAPRLCLAVVVVVAAVVGVVVVAVVFDDFDFVCGGVTKDRTEVEPGSLADGVEHLGRVLHAGNGH